MANLELTFRPVTKSRWGDFEALFESRGCPSYCWCMAWRPIEGKRQDATNADRKAAIEARIKRNVPVGLLGYEGKEPVAWVSIAPKETFLKSLGGKQHGETGEKIWSLVCMFLKRSHRKQGIGHQLIAAAVAEARKRGADVIEGYPVDPGSPSYLFMGFIPAFEKAGFSEVERVGARRHLMRLPLRKSK
jgi:GNAT superfamily N-acetyltransferase